MSPLEHFLAWVDRRFWVGLVYFVLCQKSI